MFLLHLYYTHEDVYQTLAFPSAFARALHMILLSSQPVRLSIEDLS